jgi:hypothetical protein
MDAQHNGALANPRISREMDKTDTLVLTFVYLAITFSAGAIMLLPKEAARASMPSWKVIHTLKVVLKFLGLSGSLGSQSTRYLCVLF